MDLVPSWLYLHLFGLTATYYGMKRQLFKRHYHRHHFLISTILVYFDSLKSLFNSDRQTDRDRYDLLFGMSLTTSVCLLASSHGILDTLLKVYCDTMTQTAPACRINCQFSFEVEAMVTSYRVAGSINKHTCTKHKA